MKWIGFCTIFSLKATAGQLETTGHAAPSAEPPVPKPRKENRMKPMPSFKELFKQARKSPEYVKERLRLLQYEMRADRSFIKVQVQEIAKLTAGNSLTEPTVNERCILNICESITKNL
jgi:hypothetical protein